VSLRPALAFNPRPRRLSTSTDAFQLHPDVRLYRTALTRDARRPPPPSPSRRRASSSGDSPRASATLVSAGACSTTPSATSTRAAVWFARCEAGARRVLSYAGPRTTPFAW
jgi:hypothetical protein